MNRLNEYLENLDRRNLLMLYVSVLILFFIIIYYLYQYDIIPKKKELYQQKTDIIKKMSKFKNSNKELVSIRKKLKKQKIMLNEAKEDLSYLKILIYSTPKLYISQDDYLKILDNYIAIGANLNASFELSEKKDLRKYNLLINGKYSPYDYATFVRFLKVLQKPQKIITINNMNVEYNKSVIYEINMSMWSVK